jgi:hypothetical protein
MSEPIKYFRTVDLQLCRAVVLQQGAYFFLDHASQMVVSVWLDSDFCSRNATNFSCTSCNECKYFQ